MTDIKDALHYRSNRRRWIIWLFSPVALIIVWSSQPHFGANVCPLKGFMWTTDFVDEIRPLIHKKIITRSVGKVEWPPNGVTFSQIISVADQAIDLLKQCVVERGLNYCRYAGPNPKGTMMDAYTIDGPNSIAPEDRYRYRYIKADADYEISMVPQDAGGSRYRIQTTRFGKPLDVAVGSVCYLGCWCDLDYSQ